mmetsp:Transcript_89861/g.253424  ORF Transcript_89861/g.253424 Transcript_89861/m.253424 type:complete len:243 (-) Transcript_89861:825-1553(-)
MQPNSRSRLITSSGASVPEPCSSSRVNAAWNSRSFGRHSSNASLGRLNSACSLRSAARRMAMSFSTRRWKDLANTLNWSSMLTGAGIDTVGGPEHAPAELLQPMPHPLSSVADVGRASTSASPSYIVHNSVHSSSDNAPTQASNSVIWRNAGSLYTPDSPKYVLNVSCNSRFLFCRKDVCTNATTSRNAAKSRSAALSPTTSTITCVVVCLSSTVTGRRPRSRSALRKSPRRMTPDTQASAL